jgi:hypothetical protein
VYADVHGSLDFRLDAICPRLVENMCNIPIVGDSSGNSRNRSFLSLLERVLTADIFQSLEVVRLHGGDIFSTKHTNLEVLDLGVQRRARRNEVLEVLVDDCIRANVFGDFRLGSVVCDQLFGVCQINTVDMGISMSRVSKRLVNNIG